MYSTFGLSKRPKIVGHRRTSLHIVALRHTSIKAKLDSFQNQSPVITTNLFLVWQHLHF
jgi:hypothetical protein